VVKDTGRGIAAAALPYIFEPFHQEDSGSNRSEGGLGLGLALVRRLIDMHGGEVVAESAGKGQGTTITVTLPTLRPIPDSAGETQEARRGRFGRPALDGMRILVVDDDPEFLDLATLILRRAGAEVRAVASAVRAHKLVESWLPNVLLTDLAMPGEDGFVLATAMKATFAERRAQVSIIALTAYGTSETRARAATAGFDRYLTKPVDPVSLPDVIAKVVGWKA
jgi:CheY-like chemotaxis protein